MARRLLVTGIDEAGYGPTLGPLVVVRASVGADAERTVAQAFHAADTGVADSKRVHRPGAPARLETVALGAIAWATGRMPRTAADLFPPDAGPVAHAPWLADAEDCRLPLAASRPAAWELPDLAAAGLETVVIHPRQLNREALAGRNKAALELATVVDLLRAAWRDADRTRATVDRLGGRRYYGPALTSARPGAELEVVTEVAGTSSYRLHGDGGDHRVDFRVQGEAASPLVALASCVAKYVREIQMHLFNRYWCARIPGLAPTAGYPQDARRWLADLGPALVERHGHDLVRGWTGPGIFETA